MYPMQHLIFGIIFTGFIFLLFPLIGFFGVLLIILSGVLIDIDHYIYYVYRKKDLSLKNAYNGYVERRKKFISLPRKERNKVLMGIFFLHGFEVLFILLLASIFISKYFLFILLAFNFHLLLDILETKTYLDRPIKISLIYDILSSKKLKIIDF